MSILDITAVLISLAALLAYLNERLFRLPNTIGIMLIGLALSLLLQGTALIYPGADDALEAVLRSVDFDTTVLQGMLSFLLFAGALHVNVNDLFDQKWIVLILATVGVLTSTVLVGLGTWLLSRLVGLDLPLIYCLVFGALISPTDPIAVLGIIRRLGAPREIEVMITGESLFNDGVGVVIFIVLTGIAADAGGENAGFAGAATLFLREAVGGAVFGLVLGYLGFWLLRTIDNYHVEILITLAMVMGGFALASRLHLSGPIAIVVAGLFAGNQGRRLAMSESTRQRLDDFWELLDEILNAVLFLLIGIEVLVISFRPGFLLAGLLAIPMVLVIRAIAVGLPIGLMRWHKEFPPRAVTILTWAGLRGGISVALALSLPNIPAREPLVAMTYVIVVFSILVQGLTLGRLFDDSAAESGTDE